jgi:hypothetical protein
VTHVITPILETNKLFCSVLKLLSCVCATCVAQRLYPFMASSSHKVSLSHTTRHSRWDSSWKSDQLVAETSTEQNTQHPQQTNIHDSSGIQTHDRSRRAATGTGVLCFAVQNINEGLHSDMFSKIMVCCLVTPCILVHKHQISHLQSRRMQIKNISFFTVSTFYCQHIFRCITTIFHGCPNTPQIQSLTSDLTNSPSNYLQFYSLCGSKRR